MEYTDVPQVKVIGHAVDVNTLASLLAQAVDDPLKPFIYRDHTRGGPRYCGFLFQNSVRGYSARAPIINDWDCETAAREFIKTMFLDTTLFDPPTPPSPEMVKGWEVRRATIHGQSMVILETAWV